MSDENKKEKVKVSEIFNMMGESVKSIEKEIKKDDEVKINVWLTTKSIN